MLRDWMVAQPVGTCYWNLARMGLAVFSLLANQSTSRLHGTGHLLPVTRKSCKRLFELTRTAAFHPNGCPGITAALLLLRNPDSDRFRLVMTALNQSEIPGEMMGFLSVLVQVIWLKSSTSLLLNCLSSWFDCNVQLCQVKTEDWPGYM